MIEVIKPNEIIALQKELKEKYDADFDKLIDWYVNELNVKLKDVSWDTTSVYIPSVPYREAERDAFFKRIKDAGYSVSGHYIAPKVYITQPAAPRKKFLGIF